MTTLITYFMSLLFVVLCASRAVQNFSTHNKRSKINSRLFHSVLVANDDRLRRTAMLKRMAALPDEQLLSPHQLQDLVRNKRMFHLKQDVRNFRNLTVALINRKSQQFGKMLATVKKQGKRAAQAASLRVCARVVSLSKFIRRQVTFVVEFIHNVGGENNGEKNN